MRAAPALLHRLAPLALALHALGFAGAVAAQAQNVRPPIAVYWMSVETAAGMAGMGGMASMMGQMMGGQQAQAMQGGKRMTLQLGSSQAAAGEPRAQHEVPPATAMTPALPLLSPRDAPAAREPAERDLPQGMEKPRGRMLIYWGCGESARAGQPVVIDFAKIADGRMPPNLVARRVATGTPPHPGRSKSYGDWPNRDDARAVPEQASLRGDHLVRGNYSPEIRFAVSERHDFMPRVALALGGRAPGGAMKVTWGTVAGATGYFATVFGANANQDVVFWSSSEVQEMGGSLMDYLPPAEAARLVKDKVVLAPQATECTVPAEVVREAGTPFLNFIAYGDELTVVHPPRPSDPKQTWEQLWAVKLRLKSTASMLLSEEMMGERGGRRARAAANEGAPPQGAPGQPGFPGAGAQQDQAPPPSSPVEDGARILRGILRF